MENQNCYILEIVNKILLLQKQDFDSEFSGCDRPFLGPTMTTTQYNTRPIQLYNKYTANPWSFSYTTETGTATSDIFRIEDIDQGSVTLRLLSFDDTTSTYTNINQFVIVDLSTVGAIKCSPDTYINI